MLFSSSCSNPKTNNNSSGLSTKIYEVNSFDFEKFVAENNLTLDYQRNVGEIKDAADAVEKAKALWDNDFGIIDGKYYDPTEGRNVEVSFDQKSLCWLLCGTLPDNTFGTVPMAIIKSDGTVVSVWMPGVK